MRIHDYRSVKWIVFLFLISLLTACQSVDPTQTPPTVPVVSVETVALPQPTSSAIEPAPSVPPAAPSDGTAIVTPDRGNVTELPDGSLFQWVEIASGYAKPLDFEDAGEGIFYIVEQTGLIHVLRDGEKMEPPFLDIRKRVGTQASEQGLLGLTFDTDYTQNRVFYLDYTDKQGNTVIARYQAAADGLTADPDSEQVLLQIEQPYGNHNGGNVAFGPDGLLYIGMGDGGSGGDPEDRSQNPEDLLGKLLRIAVSGQESYAIPADNPYVNGGGRAEIFAIGLRNPWRFSFDQKTGDLYIADVGQGEWEEINFMEGVVPGVNYGWNYREGTHAFKNEPPAELELTDPIVEYGHDQGCSVTGGYVYRGSELPDLYGVYLFGDYCTGKVWGTLPAGQGEWPFVELASTGENISAFGQDQQGEVYLIAHGGRVYKLQAAHGS
jgi:glucose/arabinose dehydrogenase